jgi:hypothetical protein
MAKRTQIILIDDLDGSAADETVTFALDGVNYEIDLSSSNAARLRETFAPFAAVATRVGGRRKAGRRSGSDSGATDIRAWALGQGMSVSTRGRVSAEVRAAYEAAH